MSRYINYNAYPPLGPKQKKQTIKLKKFAACGAKKADTWWGVGHEVGKAAQSADGHKATNPSRCDSQGDSEGKRRSANTEPGKRAPLQSSPGLRRVMTPIGELP